MGFTRPVRRLPVGAGTAHRWCSPQKRSVSSDTPKSVLCPAAPASGPSEQTLSSPTSRGTARQGRLQAEAARRTSQTGGPAAVDSFPDAIEVLPQLDSWVLAASWWRTQRSAHTSKLNDELEGLQRASLPAAAGHFHHRAPTGLTAAAMVSPRTCSRIYYDVDTDVAHRRPRPGEAHMRTCPGTTGMGSRVGRSWTISATASTRCGRLDERCCRQRLGEAACWPLNEQVKGSIPLGGSTPDQRFGTPAEPLSRCGSCFCDRGWSHRAAALSFASSARRRAPCRVRLRRPARTRRPRLVGQNRAGRCQAAGRSGR